VAQHKKKTTEDQLSINIKPLIQFFKHHKQTSKALTIIILILIPLFFSIYFRSYPATLPITEQWAYDGLTNNIRAQIAANVNQQFPNLPPEEKAKAIEEQYREFMRTKEPAVREQARQQAALIKQELQNDEGQTYLLAIDPYYYWRQTKNVVDHGYGGDELRNGTPWNTHKLAPVGLPKPRDEYHERISALVYKTVRFFNPQAQLFNVFFWMPVIISALAVIPAFFIARKKAGNLGGFVAGIIVAVHTTFIGRTAAGFADTDAYNVTFPLFIFWMFLEAFEAKKLTYKALFAGLTGILIGIYSRTWGGWWYIFDFMLAVLIINLGYNIVRAAIIKKNLQKAFTTKETGHTAFTTIALIIASGIFVTLFNSFQQFIRAPLSPLGFTTIQNAARADLWPNVFTTVAELNEAGLGTIVKQIGGSLYFYLACLGVIITMIAYKKLTTKDWAVLASGSFIFLVLITKPLLRGNHYTYLALLLLPMIAGLILLLKDEREIDVKYAIFLSVWFVGTIYASTKGVRFILLLVPAYSVALGILFGQVYKMITTWAREHFGKEQQWLKIGLIIFILILLIKPITAGHKAALYEVPSMNDDWWKSLEKIKEESAPNAIINSWWDFGHWFKAIADRPVTFDGASQNTPMAHWIGKVLSTSNEQEAIGILRMLDCGSRTGFDELAMALQGVNDLRKVTPETTLRAKNIMDRIILIWDKEEAKKVLLKEGLTEKEAEKILKLTHCNPPEDYFITSSDMVGKAGVWGHFGNWDFRKAYVYNVLTKKTPEEATPIIAKIFNTTEKEASKIYYEALSLPNEEAANTWISPWPNYLTPRLVTCKNESEIVICPVNSNIGKQQGQIIRLEQALINLSEPSQTALVIGYYEQATGRRIGQNLIQPLSLVLTDEGFKKIPLNGKFNYDLLLDKQGDKYRILIAAPQLSTGMFTRLFYLEGKGTTHFEKFSDRRSPLTGDRIIVWKVNWEE